MRNHNNENNSHKGMMWMMIPCILLLGILFIGGDKLSSSGYFWPILVGLFVVGYIWMMFSGHGKRGGRGNDNDKDSKHKHGNCCH